MNRLSNFNNSARSGFNSVFKSNKLASIIIQVLILAYIGRITPELPQWVLTAVSNPYFRLFIFVVIFMYSEIDFTTAVLVSVAFLMTMHLITKENLENEAVVEQVPAGVIVAPSSALAAQQMNSDMTTPVFVESINTSSETIIIKPTVDSLGNMTVPNVIVAPVMTVNENGETKTIEANVSVATPAPAPPTAPLPESASFVPSTPEEQVQERSCYPSRRIDITKVIGAETQVGFGEYIKA